MHEKPILSGSSQPFSAGTKAHNCYRGEVPIQQYGHRRIHVSQEPKKTRFRPVPALRLLEGFNSERPGVTKYRGQSLMQCRRYCGGQKSDAAAGGILPPPAATFSQTRTLAAPHFSAVAHTFIYPPEVRSYRYCSLPVSILV